MNVKDHPSRGGVLRREEPVDAGATPVHQVTPLNYTQLRLLAECTAGLDETQVNFVFTADEELRIRPVPLDSDVLIPAYDESKYPPNQVRLQVAAPGTPGAPGLHLQVGIADAVFWSDAAVQKFLFPWVTSCAGTDASRVLARLQAAWNYYPAARVSVYALVHVINHLQQPELSLENSLYVVYAQRLDGEGEPSLALAPLDEFLGAFPPAPGAAETPQRAGSAWRQATGGARGGTAPRVAYHRGRENGARQHPDYVTLRALAEYACALRNEPRYFLLKAGEQGFRPLTTGHLPDVDAGDIVIPAYNPTTPADRPRLHGVWCHTQDDDAPNLAAMADAVFWSNGAIEQFLYPYYASKGGMRDGLKELIDLSYAWTGQLPPGLQPERAADAAGGPARAVAAAVNVIATVHIITSEYVQQTVAETPVEPVDDAPVSRLAAGRELALVYEHDGRTHVHTMAEFMALHWPRRA